MATQSSQIGANTPTTFIFDVQDVQNTSLNLTAFRELLIRLYQNLNLMANVVNVKETGIYNNAFEMVDGQTWFPNPANNSATVATASLRQNMRTVIVFGGLPNAVTKSIPHRIFVTAKTSWTHIYGAATDPVGLTGIPIPYSSATALANQVELNVDANNVNITTGSNRTNYTICYVVLEYLQS